MDVQQFTAFIAFALITSITPGPNNLMVMASAAAFGWTRTLPLISGIALGIASMLGAAALGLGALLQQAPELLVAVRLLGAAWLLWLAWQFAAPAVRRRPPAGAGSRGPAVPGRPLRAYEAALFQWINPKAWTLAVAASAAYAGLAPDAATRALVMIAAILVIAPFSNSVWALAGSALRRLTGEGATGRVFGLAMALLIVVSAVVIALG